MPSARESVSGQPAESEAQQRRILIVDDSSLIREVAVLALSSRSGWEAVTASSGEEGLARALSDRPDAVLLDVVMPGIDGYEVAERLAASPSTSAIPVIMLTAADGPGDRERLRRLAVAGVIPKPFELAQLASQVAAVLGWQS
jgi:CheY-like chemotaxis protein